MVHASGYSQIGLARKNPDENRRNGNPSNRRLNKGQVLLRTLRRLAAISVPADPAKPISSTRGPRQSSKSWSRKMRKTPSDTA
jgi:hypothetical protein